MKTENHPYGWNCCQRCGETLTVGQEAAGAFVPPDVTAKDVNGRSMAYVYEHKGRCPRKEK